MKKSDALELIYDYLNCDGVLEYSYPPKQIDFTEEHLRDMSADILRHLVEAGMLAPLNDENYCYMDNDDRRLNNLFSKFHEWEDEELDKES